MEDSTIKAVTAMICITAVECVALVLGINGVLLASVIGILGGIGGYEIKAWRNGR